MADRGFFRWLGVARRSVANLLGFVFLRAAAPVASSGYGGRRNLRENEALPHGLTVPDPGPAGGLPGGFPNLPGGLPAGMANNPMMQQVAGAVEETLKHGKLRF
jgi:hypothetical protein